jgi:hypothetical protein
MKPPWTGPSYTDLPYDLPWAVSSGSWSGLWYQIWTAPDESEAVEGHWTSREPSSRPLFGADFLVQSPLLFASCRL